ncbi:MAG: hypothetical protein IJW51_08290 [Clostridia bacterium]|nr:hypothetical protein [Clostridia bacterium]
MLENILFPSLLPFLILSELFVTLGAGRVLGRVIARPARALFGLTENGAAVLALGWLCGVPVGTVSAMTMLKNGDISREEFLRLLLFANTPSTGFLVGTVGGALFGNRTAGMVLFLCVLLAAALTGVALKLQGGNLPPCGTMQHTPQRVSFFRALTSAIQKSVFTMMGVAGFVLFFSALSECVTVIATVRQLPPLLASLLCGALELTAGVSAVVSKHPPAVAFLLTAGFAGFAGLSICLQIFAVSADAQPRLCPYLTAKILQGAITLLLAALYLALAHPQLTVAQNGFAETVSTAGELHTYTRHTMLALLALLALIPLCRRRAVTFYRIEK